MYLCVQFDACCHNVCTVEEKCQREKEMLGIQAVRGADVESSVEENRKASNCDGSPSANAYVILS